MAVELANAYVTLSVETSSISRQVGRMFNGVESQAGKTGRNMGRSMATSFDKAKPNVEVLEAAVKRAQDRVVAHKESGSRKMEAANRKVEIAQARVNEVTKKYGPDSSQALQAQDQLITAQQKAEAASLDYNDTLKKLEGQLNDAQKAFDNASAASGKSRTVWQRATDSLSKVGGRMRGVGDRMMDVGANFKTAGGRISDVGTNLTKLTSPISMAVTAAAGLVGVLGFKRLVGIDTAKSQIKGLGYDAEAVMEDVDRGVTDTSLSMAEGAAIARSALATGNVEVGQELEDQIKRVANVSAAYGIEGEHAGYLLNNILTKNKVTWGDLSQMQQNQIPIVSQLADHYGVTGDEIEKMAQDGQISIEDLNTVLDENAGAAAEEYSNSWQGIFANIKANIGKIGAAGLDKFFQVLKTEAGGFLDVLRSDQLKNVAESIGETLGNAFQKLIDVIKAVVGWFAGLSPVWQTVIIGAIGFATALGPILIVVGKLVVGIGGVITAFGWLIKFLALLTNPIGLIITTIGLLVGAFTYLWKTNEGFRNFFITAWEAIKTAAVWAWENALKPVFQGIGDIAVWLWENAIQPTFGFFADAWGWVVSAGSTASGFLSTIFAGIGAIAIWLWESAIQPVFGFFADAWSWIVDAANSAWQNYLQPVFDAIGIVVTWLWENIISPYFSFIWGLWMSLGEVFMLVWQNVLSPVFGWFGDIAVWLWEHAIKPVFGFIGSAFQAVGTVFMWVWENVLSPVFTWFADIAMWLWEHALSPVFSWIGDKWQYVLLGMQLYWEMVLKPVFMAIATVAQWLWENVLSPVFSWIGEHWSTVLDIMKWAWTYILQPVFNAIAVVARWLWENVLSPVFSFIGRHWDKVLTAMKWAWTYILQPVFSAVAFVARWLWETVLSPVFTFIGRHWDKILTAMKWAWDYILHPVWLAVKAVAMWLWENILKKVFTWIGDHWEEIVLGIKLAWEKYLKPTWERVKSVATWLWEKLRDIFTWIGNKWSSMKDRISSVYEKHIKPVFEKFGDIVENLKSRFGTAVDNIKKQWNRLKGIAAKPIKFVIQDIFNDGLINALNKIPGVNIPDIPEPGWINQYATGGHTGPGSKWTPAGIVHADEYVVQKASRRPFERENPGLLDHINRHGTMAGYANGGMVRPVKGGRVTSGFGAGRGRYPHAGIDLAVPIGTPVFAAMDGTVLGFQPPGRTGRYVFLSHPGGRNTYYGHLSKPLVKPGQQVRQGQRIALSGNTGKSTGPHLHYETWRNGSPVNPAKYLSGAVLPLGQKGAEAGGGWFDPLAAVRALGDKITSSLTSKFPNAGYMLDASIGLAKQGFDSMLDWAQSKVSLFNDGGEGGASDASGDVVGKVRGVADKYGWGSGGQWSALSQLISRESSWNPNAANPRSTARGLFQKMTSIHGAIESSAAGQAEWGLKYIKQRYGSPAAALAFHNRHNHYADGGLVRDSGGVVPPGSSVIHNFTRDPEWMYTNKQQDTVQAALDIAKNGAGARMVFNAPVYMRDEDDFIDAYDKKSRRRRAVGLVSTL